MNKTHFRLSLLYLPQTNHTPIDLKRTEGREKKTSENQRHHGPANE